MTASISDQQCKIGFGLLPDGEFYNLIRELELNIYAKIGDHQGLNQPPHVTIKRPFAIERSDIGDYIAVLKGYAAKQEAIDVSYGQVKWFDDETAYVPIESGAIHHAHMTLLNQLKEYGIQPGEFEGDNFIPHSSVALEFTPAERIVIDSALQQHVDIGGQVRFDSVGLFLNVDSKHWVIVATQKLSA